MLTTAEEIIPKVIASEGGPLFTDDPDDRGGATKWGITLNTWLAKGWDVDKDGDIDLDDLKKSLEKDAIAFYKKRFWDAGRIGEYPAHLRYALMDMFVNHGANGFGILAQAAGLPWRNQYVKVNPAGNISYWNDEAFIKLAQGVSVEKLMTARAKYYQAIVKNDATQEKFIRGWLNRANHVLEQTRKVFGDTAKLVSQNPVTTALVLVAAGAGLFFLMRIRKKR